MNIFLKSEQRSKRYRLSVESMPAVAEGQGAGGVSGWVQAAALLLSLLLGAPLCPWALSSVAQMHCSPEAFVSV